MRNIDLFGNYDIPRRTATQAFMRKLEPTKLPFMCYCTQQMRGMNESS